jgi:hypothetical protein
MPYPSLVAGLTAAQYRERFERAYCHGAIQTFDGIGVRFRKMHFNHAFFESSRRDGSKDQFSTERAERLDWIKATLEDSAAERYLGYNKETKSWDKTRRVAVVQGNYVVIIRLLSQIEAEFVTAFVADSAPPVGKNLSTLDKIKMGRKWQ